MIVFRNPGTIDLRALRTFGLSSKAGQQDKIGRFGTGLKYATAVIARGGGALSIWTDGAWHDLTSDKAEFRGQAVTQLFLNGAELPFTTDLGRDWEPWMAFRELYSNALDEDGGVERHEGKPTGSADETLIAVQMDKFEAIYFSMEEHFIGADETPIWKGDGLEVFQGRSKFVFNRGIAVMELKEPAAFRYNITSYLSLTEDRTAKYGFTVLSAIAGALVQCRDTDLLTKTCDATCKFEASLDFSDTTHNPSEEFLGAAVALGGKCNPTAMGVVRAQLPPDADVATIYSKSDPGAEALSGALSVARSVGVDMTRVKFVLAHGIRFYGDYEVRKDAVFLHEDIFQKPERMLIAVLEGYAEVVGHHWLAKQIVANAMEQDVAA